MHLRHGVTVEQAVMALNEAIMETVHVTSSVVQAEQKRQAYHNWADATLQRVPHCVLRLGTGKIAAGTRLLAHLRIVASPRRLG